MGALERAVVTARRDAGTRDAPPPPPKLRPVLRFARLPARALQTVRTVLDADDEFRARVGEGATEADLGRASWLFLTRPDGWQDELELLEAANAEELAGVEANRREFQAERRLAQLESTVAGLRSEHERAVAAAERAVVELDQQRARAVEAEQSAAALQRRVEDLEAERARAVKNLKATEASATKRLDELRSARERIAELERRQLEAPSTDDHTDAGDDATATGPAADSAETVAVASAATNESSPWASLDPDRVAAAVARAARATDELGAALAEAARSLERPDELDAVPTQLGAQVAAPVPAPDPGDRSRPSRRTPIRLRGGVHEGTAEGLAQLLGTAGVRAVVDGYNVSMEGWPTLDRGQQRRSLITALGEVRQRTGAVVHVVFDGDDDGRRPSVGVPLPVRVHFSHADVEADDVILAMVAELPTDVPVVVVSSDRRVGDGARRLGANVVRSAELLSLLRG